MRLFNETDYRVGISRGTYDPGSPFLTVAVKGTFALNQDGPCTALPKAKQIKIDRRTNFMDSVGNSHKTPADLVPFKARADCLFIGSAHAPDGDPVQKMDVTMSVGSMTKTLSVYGNRKWVRDPDGAAHLTAPEPFTEMPIRAETAHGGVDSKYNLHGIGYEELPDEPGASIEVANIMEPEHGAHSWEHDVPWAGFGMLSPSLLPRRAMAGTTDRKWNVRRRPLPPKDFDVRFLNAAPEDQQVDDYLIGDEDITLVNMHPEISEFRSALPGSRVLCFVNRTMNSQDPSDHVFSEMKTVLDTCIIDGPAETLTLVWRGTIGILDRHQDQIDHLLVVEEPVAHPKSRDDYLAQLQKKLVDRDAAAANEAAAAREKEVAEIQAQALKDALAALKEGGAPANVIDAVGKQTSLEDIQEIVMEWVEKMVADLPKPKT